MEKRIERKGATKRSHNLMFHTLIPIEIAEKMDEIVDKYRLSYSGLLRDALIEYINKIEQMEKQNGEQ
jgi:metal-responsive CopG/Arc/MetJ family transcriptional regulator